MNYQQLLNLAYRGSLVRWHKSGIIERLFIGRPKRITSAHTENLLNLLLEGHCLARKRKKWRPILALGPITRVHIIVPTGTFYACEEIDPRTLISFKELITIKSYNSFPNKFALELKELTC